MTAPTMRVEAAFGYGPYDAGKVWTALTAKCLLGDWTRGAQHLSGQATGESTFTFFDPSRDLDPLNAASPYAGQLLPMTPIRAVATWAGVDYPRFSGFVERWPTHITGPADQSYPVKAVDERKILNLTSGPTSVWALEVALSGPDGWWRLSDQATSTVAVDRVAQQDGRYNGGTRQTAGGIYGDSDAAVALLTNEYVTLGAGVNGTEDFSFAVAYFNATDLQVGVDPGHPLAQQSAGVANEGAWFLQVAPTAVGATFGWTVDFDTFDNGSSSGRRSGGMVNPTFARAGWHLVIVRRSGANTWLSVDGVDYPGVYSQTGSPPCDITPTGIQLGGDTGPATVDEAVLWRRKLSDAEVAAFYEAYTAPWTADKAGARIGRLLDLAGSTSPRALADGISRFQPASKLAGTVLAQVDRVVADEAGRFFFAGDGTATLHDRHHDLGSTPKYTLGPDAGEIHYLDGVEPVIDDSELCNYARMQRIGGQERTAEDATSRARFGDHTPSWADRTDLDLISDAEVKGRCEWAVFRYAEPVVRIPKVVVTPSNTDPATAYPAILGTELGDRVTFKARPMLAAAAFTAEQIVEQIHETFDPASDTPWTTELSLVGADMTGYWVWDTSEWDTDTVWAF